MGDKFFGACFTYVLSSGLSQDSASAEKSIEGRLSVQRRSYADDSSEKRLRKFWRS